MVRNGGGGRAEAHVSPPSSLRGLAAGEVLARGCEAAGGGVEAAARAAAVAGGGVRGVAGLRVVVGAVPRVPAQRAVALLLGDAGVRVALGHVSRLTWHGAACRRAAAGPRVVRAVLVRAHCGTTTIRNLTKLAATPHLTRRWWQCRTRCRTCTRRPPGPPWRWWRPCPASARGGG